MSQPVGQPFWIRREVGRQHLDGDGAVQASIARAIHLAHAAGPEEILEDVRSELASGQRGATALAFTVPYHDLSSRAGGWIIPSQRAGRRPVAPVERGRPI